MLEGGMVYMNLANPIILKKTQNRIELNLTVFKIGKDFCIILTGGDAHIGAVTVGFDGHTLETIQIPRHKEHLLTIELGKMIQKKLYNNFVICCGIHLDNITGTELNEVLYLSRQLIQELCLQLNGS
jgi:hypothetical protein